METETNNHETKPKFPQPARDVNSAPRACDGAVNDHSPLRHDGRSPRESCAAIIENAEY